MAYAVLSPFNLASQIPSADTKAELALGPVLPRGATIPGSGVPCTALATINPLVILVRMHRLTNRSADCFDLALS